MSAEKIPADVLDTFWPGRFMTNLTDAFANLKPGEWVTFRGNPDGSVSTVRFADRSTRPAEPAPEVEVGDGGDDLTAAFMAGFARGKDAAKAEADRLRASLSRALQERDEAVRILKPFADFGERIPAFMPGDIQITRGSPLLARQITVADFLAAARLRADHRAGDGGEA